MRRESGTDGRAAAVSPGATTAGGPLRPDVHVHVAWAGEHRFDSGRPRGPQARLDGSGTSAQSPVDSVLSALGACAAVDVVDILAKRRTPLSSLEVEATGERATGTPRRLLRIALDFRLAGEGIERVHAERAVELSLTKYCSVRSSLATDIVIQWRVTLGGESGEGEGEGEWQVTPA
ncbi:MAG: OsmC family protein [Gemmatimonadaceae bacterium]